MTSSKTRRSKSYMSNQHDILATSSQTAKDNSDNESTLSLEREMTLKDRQDAMNKKHPFGLPIWKPALYKKSRSVVRKADKALHSSPSTDSELFLDPGNIIWFIVFGWWLWSVVGSLSFLMIGTPYRVVLKELAFYLLWPFGQYVEQQSQLNLTAEDEEIGLITNKKKNMSLMEIIQLGPAAYLYYFIFYLILAPLLLLVSVICWMSVVSVPMAKLTYILVKHLRRHPLSLRFKSSPLVSNRSVILLCTYQAISLQYYKYTFDGVNIIFINLLPVVFFVIMDDWLLKPSYPDLWITSPPVIFGLSLASVIPLSYFIGMGVSSISTQSSMGVGAVINATFGSIIEIILYGMALVSGKSELVEGALIGSFIAGVLLMPGCSMVSGAFKKKEQRFNSKSAGVTATLLIMSIIGALAPTLFYQMFGSIELKCIDCDYGNNTMGCSRCYYDQLNPTQDPVYENNVKPLMWLCAAILPTVYIVGLVFSLHTHVDMVWKNQPTDNLTYYQRLMPTHLISQLIPSKKPDTEEEEEAGHDSPNWGKNKSFVILFGCTLLYSTVAEILVDTIDDVMKNSRVDEKFLGLTLFALVPSITEFMNAISFSMNGNIVLSMEIGSAYALQVCLVQIPAMVGFSVWYNYGKEELAQFTFSLVFRRWDVISVIFSVFLLTYTYQEGKANYFKGSILILSYLVLIVGFYFIPASAEHSVLN